MPEEIFAAACSMLQAIAGYAFNLSSRTVTVFYTPFLAACGRHQFVKLTIHVSSSCRSLAVYIEQKLRTSDHLIMHSVWHRAGDME